MVIGICGGSGSGKTTLLKRLSNTFQEIRPTVFIMDNYYKPFEEQQRDKNDEVNFDLPTALERDRLSTDLNELLAGNKIDVKEYHFNAPPGKNVLLTLEPSELTIVEGLFLFEYKEVAEKLDFSIFIDVDPDIQLDRRIYRDQDTRGYSRDAIIYQWNNHVKPCYEKYLLPYKKDADFIFHNDKRADAEYEVLVKKLKEKLT
ncbi:MAG: uridine kinase family protein [Lishizhenia sp.]